MQLTMAPGASVAEVARAHGVNANQVFKWRRAFERGELMESCAALIPVTISSGTEAAKRTGRSTTDMQWRRDSHRVCWAGDHQRGERR